MSQDLHEMTVRYSFVEHYSCLASSREEADRKFNESIRKNRLTPVGLSYGDLEAEVIEERPVRMPQIHPGKESE